jgi:hypothetical protein
VRHPGTSACTGLLSFYDRRYSQGDSESSVQFHLTPHAQCSIFVS